MPPFPKPLPALNPVIHKVKHVAQWHGKHFVHFTRLRNGAKIVSDMAQNRGYLKPGYRLMARQTSQNLNLFR